jgi:hypothetical protein
VANCLTKAMVLVGVEVLVGLMQLPTLLFADEHCWESELLAKQKIGCCVKPKAMAISLFNLMIDGEFGALLFCK